MLETLTNPTAFFRSLNERKPNLVMPFLLTMAAFVMASLGGVLLTRLLPSPIPGGFITGLVFAVVGGTLLGIVFWGLGGAIVRLLAGPESRAWEVYGWAIVPSLLVGLILLPVSAVFPITGNVPPIPSAPDPESLRAWQREYQQVVNASIGTYIQQGLSLIANLWSLWIVWSGIKVFSPQRANLTVVVLGVFSLGLALWGIVAGRLQ